MSQTTPTTAPRRILCASIPRAGHHYESMLLDTIDGLTPTGTFVESDEFRSRLKPLGPPVPGSTASSWVFSPISRLRRGQACHYRLDGDRPVLVADGTQVWINRALNAG